MKSLEKEINWELVCPTCGRLDGIDWQCNEGSCENLDDWQEFHHCRDAETHQVIPPINDCEDHFHKCMLDCHSECKCQKT